MHRNGGLTAINIIGFTIGLAAGFMIYLWVEDELRFDGFHHNSKQIYRVVKYDQSGSNITKTIFNSSNLGENMQELFPCITDNTFIYCSNDYLYFQYNGNNIGVMPATVQKNFFNFFDYPFLEGNPESAFKEPYSIVVSDKLAGKLFGNKPAFGQVLTGTGGDYLIKQGQPYRITGVVKLPHNTHISFDVALAKEDSQLYWSSGAVYLRFTEKFIFNEQIKEKLSRYLVDHEKGKNLLGFQPLKDIHLKTDVSYYHDHNLGNSQYVVVFSILAVIIVLMGAFNFMSISTSQAAKRIKEVALRKVNFGSQNELMIQFFFETLIYIIISMILAIVLANIFLPYLNSFTGKEMTLAFGIRFWITLLLSLLAVCLVAGSYPALYLSSFSPMTIFKGGNITGGKTGFIRIMVVVQFIISIALIICTLVVFKQLSYIANKDLGIDKENIITARCNIWYGVDEFKQEVMRNPNVLSVGMSLLSPESFSYEMKSVTWDGKTTEDTVRMNMAMVDGDFAKTYGLQLVHGELFKTSYDDFLSGKAGGVMINESAARVIGINNPVGININGQKIMAVVRDFHFRPLKEPVVPLIMAYSAEAVTNISFKLAPVNQQATIAFIKETYERMRPGTAFEYRFFKDKITERYKTENELGLLFLIFTLLSLSISCLGILGLTAINTSQRTKEIGLRKISGASMMSIMLLLNKNYIRWIAIAFIIAVPVAALLMNRWLQDFAYHTPLSWWIFLLSGIITLIVAAATNSWICYNASRQNPVNLLRYE